MKFPGSVSMMIDRMTRIGNGSRTTPGTPLEAGPVAIVVIAPNPPLKCRDPGEGLHQRMSDFELIPTSLEYRKFSIHNVRPFL